MGASRRDPGDPLSAGRAVIAGRVYECASAHLDDSVTLALEIESERSP
jgi:hypothetical protein